MPGTPAPRSPAVIILVVFLALGVLLFLPLGVAFLEHHLFGTHAVYRFFDRLGVADALDVIYSPVVRFFDRLFQFLS